MEINKSKSIKKILFTFILMILPILIIVIGLIANFNNALFYILLIIWFGMGMIFFYATN